MMRAWSENSCIPNVVRNHIFSSTVTVWACLSFFTLDEVEYFIHLSKKFVGMPPMISTDLGVKQTVWCCLASKRYVCLSQCHKSLEAGS